MRIYKNRLPFLRIKLVDFIPPRYSASEVACYVPVARTMIIRRGNKYNMASSIMHEFGHWLIHLLGGGHELQLLYDNMFNKLIQPVLVIIGKINKFRRPKTVLILGNEKGPVAYPRQFAEAVCRLNKG